VVLFPVHRSRHLRKTEQARKPANALDVVVIGHQYWWEYRYPASGVVTANKLHLPASDPKPPRPPTMTMSSADVDPQLLGAEFWPARWI